MHGNLNAQQMQVSGLHLEVDAGGEGYVRRHSHESKKNCSSMCMYKDAVTIPRGGGGGGVTPPLPTTSPFLYELMLIFVLTYM